MVILQKNSSHNYKTYAEIYDAIKGDRTQNIELINNLIELYSPSTTKILDIACGTGEIMLGLSESYNITGLDKSQDMLKIAKKKLPNSNFILSDMTTFKITHKFETIYCLHNSVNHLLSLQEWDDFFANVAGHLKNGGLFIFDINPITNMDRLSTLRPGVICFNDNYLISGITKDSQQTHLYHWDLNILIRKTKRTYKRYNESITVSSFSTEKVIKSVSRYFIIINHFILEQADNTDDYGREYYICLKK